MSVEIILDETIPPNDIILHVHPNNPHLSEIYSPVKTPQTIAVFLNEREYFLPISEILFIETNERRLNVHTREAIYESRLPLYKMADQLPGTFMQISKSALVSLPQVSAITRSLSNCLVSFQNSHKQIYVARRYYRAFREKSEERRQLNEK
ncbi:LytTR family DNA-binding domain-containing protein [Enterococcus timonensis]|uniref:LytTR family DNA-binding domain-containing protein n=1 Tax=Enterococcus timonensis TaxID=1852364 RepID=UPI0008DAC680|nr:LytTR family DNA-binding domain-containing protein [Enterococcus timonensis]